MFEHFNFAYCEWAPSGAYYNQNQMSFGKLQAWLDSMSIASKYFVSINSTYGYSNHIPFFDFDCDDEEAIETAKEKQLLLIHEYMQKYTLDGFLFETLHGYHLILNDLYSYSRYMAMLSNVACCEGFKSFTHQRQCASLRLTAKPDRLYDITYWGRINYTNCEAIHPVIKELFDLRDYVIEHMSGKGAMGCKSYTAI